MTKVSINGIEFNAGDGEPSDMLMFCEGSPQATDSGPFGMVEEMKSFIRIQDEHGLRNLVDVGALFGVFSLVFTRYPDAKAYAFEPSESAYQGLLENCVLNQNRFIVPYKELLGNDDYGQVLCGREWKHVIPKRKGDDGNLYPYLLQTLDHTHDCSFFPNVDCMKIDVEGYECEVLRGAERTIEEFRPIIFLEAHFSVLKEVSGDSNESLFNLIKNLGYRSKTFQGEIVTTFDGVNGHRYVLYPN